MKVFCSMLILLVPHVALADVEMRFTDGSFGLVRDGRVIFGDDANGVLFVPDEEGMIIISHEERTWMRMKPGFANDVAAKMQAQMDAMLADLPPEQRAMVQQQMEGMLPPSSQDVPKMNISRTGQTAEVAGYRCYEAEISHADGTVDETVCVASADELGMSRGDYASLIRAMRGMAEVAGFGNDSIAAIDFKALGGIPIRSRGATKGSVNELLSVDTSAVDASRLSVPDNYREASLDELMDR